MKQVLTHAEVLAEMRKRQGQRKAYEFAAELGITTAYLSDIYAGKRGPGKKVLTKLGLSSDRIYRRTA
jgi:transcriptional regulator with XRE-family HTH domain